MFNKANLIEYLPPYLRNVRELKKIVEAENPEFDAINNEINNFLHENFLDLMGVTGIKRWEQILEIKPFKDDTLEDRRFRIKSRVLERLPYTLPSLRFRLDTILGEGKYKLNIDYGKYLVKLKIELTAKSQFNEVVKMLNKVLPANMVQEVELLYNQHQHWQQFTHAELQNYTHYQFREEVI